MTEELALAEALRETQHALATASRQLEQLNLARDSELQRMRDEISELRHRRSKLQQWLEGRKASLRAVEERVRVLEQAGTPGVK